MSKGTDKSCFFWWFCILDVEFKNTPDFQVPSGVISLEGFREKFT